MGLIFLSSFTTLSAFEITSQEKIKIDTSIARSDLSYSVPTKIIIVPISIESDLTQAQKYRGLYYYLVQKLGFSDIPFHYVISANGEVFQGNQGGDERKVQVQGIDETIILVGYLTGTIRDSFDPRSINNLSELLLDIANRNSISTENISVSKLTFVRDSETKSVFMRINEAEASWKGSLESINAGIKPRYSPTAKEYAASSEIVGITTEEVDPGSEVTVSVKIKNTGKNGFYGESNSSILLSKADGSASKFFINDQWVSRSEVTVLVEHQNLLPEQEDIFEFKIRAPLAIGEVSESFSLKTQGGININSNSIDLKLKMKRSDKKIVQIRNTELGYLKVRSEPSTVGGEIGKVSPGERFFVVEDAGNGYIKIDLGNGSTGWIAGWFTDTI